MSGRRTFLKQASMGLGALAFPFPAWSSSKSAPGMSFGLVADAHLDLIPDARERLTEFTDACQRHDLSFVMQMGDFCFPKPENQDFMDLWGQIKAPSYHILGNHDMDTSSKSETMNFWGMDKAYYSFDQGGYHIVVLDANFLYQDGAYLDYDRANFYVDDAYRTFVHPEQIAWLKKDLSKTDFPTLVFSHQSLAHELWGVKNRLEIQLVMENARRPDGSLKVIACFNGHNHLNFHRSLNGIHYFEINSLSYKWLGEKYSCKTRYPAELYEKFIHLDKIAPYKDPLFTFVTLEPGWITIAGKESEWLSPSPEELGMPPQVIGSQPSPSISSISTKL